MIVAKRDEYIDGGGELGLKSWYEQEKIKETYGKCFQSVYHYARVPKEKRTPLGPKPGRPKSKPGRTTLKAAAARKAREDRAMMSRWLEEELERQKKYELWLNDLWVLCNAPTRFP